MSATLVRPVSSVSWELRRYWATGNRVAVSLQADVSRLEGFVQTVSATDAYAVIAGTHVPLGCILAVHRPSRLGDSAFDDLSGERWRGQAPRAARRDPRQLEMELLGGA